ncbi:MAG: hypothetical protein JHC31_07985, partial [Sulfurihydrogenibium sp.]|nr:hypothetical protein [Sulfurihydrogenibium sp.]
MVIEVNRSGFHRVVHSRFSKVGKSKKVGKEKREKKEKKEDENLTSLFRTKRTLRRIILNQEFSKTSFLTLTFKENITDINIARYELQKFLKRLNYHVYHTKKSKLKYLAVPERQERGAWHFHILLFDFPFVLNTDLADIWGLGFLKINQVKAKNMMEVYNYISKYITKQFQENQKHLHKYFTSQGFFKGYNIKVFDVDDTEYFQECKYWLQNLYS